MPEEPIVRDLTELNNTYLETLAKSYIVAMIHEKMLSPLAEGMLAKKGYGPFVAAYKTLSNEALEELSETACQRLRHVMHEIVEHDEKGLLAGKYFSLSLKKTTASSAQEAQSRLDKIKLTDESLLRERKKAVLVCVHSDGANIAIYECAISIVPPIEVIEKMPALNSQERAQEKAKAALDEYLQP